MLARRRLRAPGHELITLTFLLLLASALQAQNETITPGAWRVKTGDRAAWAQPGLDDSGWAVTSAPRGRVGSDKPGERVTWFRTRVDLPAWWSGQSLRLAFGPMNDPYEVFVNGRTVGRFGIMPAIEAANDGESRVATYSPRHLSFALPAATRTEPTVAVAVRVWSARPRSVRAAVTGSDLEPHDPLLGLSTVVSQHEELDTIHGFIRILPSNLLWLLIVSCGLFCVWLYRQRRDEKELLWLGLALTFNGGLRLTTLPTALGVVASNSVVAFALSWGTSFWIHFFYCWALAELLPPWRRLIRRAAPFIAFASLLSLVYNFYSLPSSATGVLWVTQLGTLVQAALGIAAAGYCLRRRQWEMAAIGVGIALRSFSNTLSNTRGGLSSFQIGPFPFLTNTIGNAILAVALACILYIRYKRRSARQREAEQDVAAARRVQEGLLATEHSDYGQFAVDTAYHPAREVGGDFYRLIPDGDGSLLVVTGDVSGKGLQAAMLVATVIGALGDLTSREPAAVLGHLNRSLYGRARGGFITCSCALLHASGRIELASAGHLPPYLDQQEIVLESGLPLGIVPDAEYSHTVMEARTGKLTFVSDGVVEAANRHGELFGFERTRQISVHSAGEIAEAARAWGHNDDITVVTVRRTA